MATVRLRDSGQLSLAQAVVSVAHRSWHAGLESPVAPGDPRAADLVLTGPREIIHIEIERALVDLQAQLRAAQLKRELLAQASSQPVRLVIAVPDTHATRTRLAPFAQLLAQTFPTSSRSIWTSLRQGEPLGGDGVLFVRAARLRQAANRLSHTTRTP